VETISIAMMVSVAATLAILENFAISQSAQRIATATVTASTALVIANLAGVELSARTKSAHHCAHCTGLARTGHVFVMRRISMATTAP